MEYLIAIQFVCGAFGAYVARRKNRNIVLWFFIAAGLPILGVVLAVVVKGARAGAAGRPGQRKGSGNPPRRPRRCNGSYISDCRGCPYFSRPLFDSSYDEAHKGRCRFYDRELYDEQGEKSERARVKE